MNVVLFDTEDAWKDLNPLTLTRPIAELRVGIHSITQKWNHTLDTVCSWATQEYLQHKYELRVEPDTLFIKSNIIPTSELAGLFTGLEDRQGIEWNGEVIAFRSDVYDPLSLNTTLGCEWEINMIRHPWDVFVHTADQIKADIDLFQYEKITGLHPSNTIIGNEIYGSPDVDVKASIINSEDGPVFFGKGVKVLEGSMIKGTTSFGDGVVVKMGAKIYGGTSIGPYSKVGGEVGNSVIQGYSNKGHDGFLGNSVLGEWCNLGADTNTSNLKNNYSEVRLHSYRTREMEGSGQQFCGVIMGDHSKCGINTMFNTGTVVGVSANIFGAGFPPKYIPSYAWGHDDATRYELDRALDVAKKVMARREIELSEKDVQILSFLHQ